MRLRRTLQETWRLELMTREQYARAADIAFVRGKIPLKGRALNAEEISKLWDNSLTIILIWGQEMRPS